MRSTSGPWAVGLAWDDSREVVVSVAGSYSSRYLNRTSEWDGGTWSTINTRVLLPERSYHGTAYDSKRRRLVVFGGRNTGGQLGDTWELVHDCVCAAKGHAGGGVPITCLTAPVLGSVFRLAFSTNRGRGTLYVGPPRSTPYLNLKQPIVCVDGSFHTNPLLAVVVTGRPAIFSAPIPNQPSLVGTRLRMQATVPQTLGCLLLTDATDVTIR